MALSTMVNWISNFIVAFITPPLFSSIGAGYYFLLMGFCVISGVFVFFVYPETAHLSLEQLGTVFGDKVQDDGRVPEIVEKLEVPRVMGRDSQSTLRPSMDNGLTEVKKGSSTSV